MTLVRVFIATTEGPVAVERITREPAAQSAVCVKRTTRVLPISSAYDAFVRAPSGVIEREFGPWEQGAFRLDVSASIGDGESWQLGVFVAHALAAERRLADPDDEASETLWITGAVDNDLGVGNVGHVAEKLHASADLIEQLKADGQAVRYYVPGDNAATTTPAGVRLEAVSSAKEILANLGLTASATPTPVAPATVETEQETLNSDGNGLRTLFTVLGIGILVVGAGAFLYFDRQVAPKPVAKPAATTTTPTAVAKPAVETKQVSVDKPQATPAAPVAAVTENPVTQPVSSPPHKPELKVFELRATDQNSCAAVQFNDAAAQRLPLRVVTGDKLPDSQSAGLCGLEFVVSVGPEDRYVAAAVNLTRGRFVRGGGLPAALQGNMAIKGKQSWRAYVPRRLRRPLTYNISVAISKTPIRGLTTNTATLTTRHRILP